MLAIVQIILSIGLLYGVSMGYGAGLARLLGLQVAKSWYGWLGFAVLMFVLSVTHLFVPINAPVTLVLSVLGLGLFIGLRAWVKLDWRIGALIGVWILAHTFQQPTNFDNMLYHLNVVEWFHQYAIVPGLVNLHTRLGFNTGFFLFGAFTNSLAPYLADRIGHSYLALIGFIWLAEQWQSQAKHRPFYAVLILAGLLISASRSQPSISNDLPISWLSLPATVLLLNASQGYTGLRQRDALFISALIAGAAFASKTSAFYHILSFGTLALLALWQARQAILRPLLFAAALAVMMASVTLLRTTISTGYPLYPLSVIRLDADFAIGKDIADLENRVIRAWGRLQPFDEVNTPERILASWDWLVPWYQRYRQWLAPVIAFGIGVLWIAGRIYRHRTWLDGLYWIPAGIALGLWFYSSPDFRFAEGVIWGGIAMGVLFMPRRLAYAIVLVFAIGSARHLLLWNPAPPTLLDQSALVPIEVDGGIIFLTKESETCIYSIPCTPYPPRLAFRIPHNLQAGFRPSPIMTDTTPRSRP